VTKSFPAGKKLSGFPARDHKEEIKERARQKKIPLLENEIKLLKEKIENLTEKIENMEQIN